MRDMRVTAWHDVISLRFDFDLDFSASAPLGLDVRSRADWRPRTAFPPPDEGLTPSGGIEATAEVAEDAASISIFA